MNRLLRYSILQAIAIPTMILGVYIIDPRAHGLEFLGGLLLITVGGIIAGESINLD